MSTPNSILVPNLPLPSRGPLLRLRMTAEHPGGNRLDGGWWPRSRDLAVELADLVDHFPPQFGRIVRALFSPPDWQPAPRRIPVAGRYVKVGSFPRDDTHLILLKTSGGSVLHLLVAPPSFSDDQGDDALLATTTPGNAHPAELLLDAVTKHPNIEPMDHWSDDGGSWWGPHPVSPSFRTGA